MSSPSLHTSTALRLVNAKDIENLIAQTRDLWPPEIGRKTVYKKHPKFYQILEEAKSFEGKGQERFSKPLLALEKAINYIENGNTTKNALVDDETLDKLPTKDDKEIIAYNKARKIQALYIKLNKICNFLIKYIEKIFPEEGIKITASRRAKIEKIAKYGFEAEPEKEKEQEKKDSKPKESTKKTLDTQLPTSTPNNQHDTATLDLTQDRLPPSEEIIQIDRLAHHRKFIAEYKNAKKGDRKQVRQKYYEEIQITSKDELVLDEIFYINKQPYLIDWEDVVNETYTIYNLDRSNKIKEGITFDVLVQFKPIMFVAQNITDSDITTDKKDKNKKTETNETKKKATPKNLETQTKNKANFSSEFSAIKIPADKLKANTRTLSNIIDKQIANGDYETALTKVSQATSGIKSSAQSEIRRHDRELAALKKQKEEKEEKGRSTGTAIANKEAHIRNLKLAERQLSKAIQTFEGKLSGLVNQHKER